MMRLLMGCTVLLLAGSALGQDVTARVSRQVVTVDEVFQLQITVRGDAARQPDLPDLPDVFLVDPNVQHGSSFSVKFVNGRSTTENLQTWSFSMSISEAGTYTIPPMAVRVAGEYQHTSPIAITVRPAVQRPQMDRRQLRLQDAVQVEASVDKREVYEGEPVELVVTLSILEYPGVHPSNMGSNSYIPPTTEGFYTTSPEKSMRTERRGEFTWRIQEFSQTLYPTRSGELSIGEWSWTGVVYGHVLSGPNRVNIRPSSEPITITVKPLPPSPRNFSGAVGEFTVQASLASALTLQGVPVRLELKVSGTGNPSLVRTPPLPPLDWAQVASEPSQAGDTTDARIERSFYFILTPHKPGNHEIPPIPFVYFDPETESFKTVETSALSLAVTPAEEEGPMITAGGAAGQNLEVATTGRRGSFQPVISTPRHLAPARSGLAANVVVGFVPPVAFTALFALVRRRRHLLENPAVLRRRQARAKAEALLTETGDQGQAIERLNKALAEFAADRFDFEAAGLTSHDIALRFQERHVPGEVADQYVQVLRACERARYAGANLADQELKALHEGALTAIAALDRLEGGAA